MKGKRDRQREETDNTNVHSRTSIEANSLLECIIQISFSNT